LILRHVKYICEPRNITIEANFPLSSRHLELEIKVNDKLAFKQYYNTKNYPAKKEDYDQFVKRFCKSFMYFTDDEIDYYTSADEYMLALNVHKNLNKVLHKSGVIVWTRA
jgi:hypothetical protein